MRPLIVSCSTTGLVYIWSSNYSDNWSGYAPDFKELEENETYIEREDEFDIILEEEEKSDNRCDEDSEELDVTTVEKIRYYSDSDEGEDMDVDVATGVALNFCADTAVRGSYNGFVL